MIRKIFVFYTFQFRNIEDDMYVLIDFHGNDG